MGDDDLIQSRIQFTCEECFTRDRDAGLQKRELEDISMDDKTKDNRMTKSTINRTRVMFTVYHVQFSITLPLFTYTSGCFLFSLKYNH